MSPTPPDPAFFLLPFDEVPIYALEDPLPLCSSAAASSDPKHLFRACLLTRRAPAAPLANGGAPSPSALPPRALRLHVGDYVLLRPAENAHRPSVARALQFWSRPEGGRFARVQWFYRAEDLSEGPCVAAGEDEVFETEHFDDVDVETVAGRCSMGSYAQWLARVASEGEAKGDDEKVERGGDHGAGVGEDESGGGENGSGRGGKGEDAATGLSDTESSYGDNYASAAVHYYCRRFYDPIRLQFAVCRFENEDADPVGELEWRARGDVEAGFEPQSSGSSDDAFDEELLPEEGEENWEQQSTRRKRKRAGRKRTRGASSGVRKARAGRTAQFSLPSDGGVTEELPCREAEKGRVRGFLEDAIRESAEGGHGGSRCLYISGVPGTGKTATVREIVRELRARRAAGEIGAFEALEVNAMSVGDPNVIYSELYTAMTGAQGLAPMHAAQLLEKRFSDGTSAPSSKARRGGGADKMSARERGKCVIMILDEMDVLVARRQKVLYDLLEWPTRRNARMAVIGIANTMDLPERMLPRLGSRLGVNRLTYAPYTAGQLEEILWLKLDRGTHDAAAVRLCAAKVGAVSGDVRRALEIMRRAREVAQGASVKAGDVVAAVSDVGGAARLEALRQLSQMERAVMACAVQAAREQGAFEGGAASCVGAVCAAAATAARKVGVEGVEAGVVEEAMERLAEMRVVVVERAAVFADGRVVPNVTAEDCLFALEGCAVAGEVLGGRGKGRGRGS